MTRTVFTNANLIDGTGAEPRPATVVIEGDQVHSVHDGPHTELQQDEQVFDLAGRTLMPGMVIGHFHAQMSSYTGTGGALGIYSGTERPPGVLMAASIQASATVLMSGFTGFVGAGCSGEIDFQLKMAIEEGYCVGPRIRPCGRVLETTGYEGENVPWYREAMNTGLYRFADGVDGFLEATRDEIRRGADIIKIQPTAGHGYPANSGQGSIGAAKPDETVHRIVKFTEEEIGAVVRAAHGKGRMVRAHVAWRDEILRCIEVGVDVIDHGDEMDEACLELMAERGTYWVPSMTFVRRLVDNENAHPESRAAVQRDYDNICKMLPLAAQAGVRVLTGDDWGLSVLGMGHELGAYAEEMDLWVRDAGIAPLQALTWATANGGALLGLPRLGLVVEGAPADLLVVAGDPSDDVGLLRDPATNLKAIMKGGEFAKLELEQVA